jgi:transcriptional regulator with XRE-family HTH domain
MKAGLKDATAYSRFPKTIKSLRLRKGMSQVEFARLLGITPGAVCNWENAVNGPSDKRLAAIAEKLEVPLEYLLLGSNGKVALVELKKTEDTGKIRTKQFKEYSAKLRAISRAKPKLARKLFYLIDEIENSLHG